MYRSPQKNIISPHFYTYFTSWTYNGIVDSMQYHPEGFNPKDLKKGNYHET